MIIYKGKNDYSLTLTQSMQPFQVQFQLWTLCCLRMSVQKSIIPYGMII